MTKFYFLIVLLVFFALGCGESVEERAMEKKIEEATGGEAEVNLSENGMKVTGETENGKFAFSTGESIEIPKDFPSDVLIYSPSTAVMAMKMPEGHIVSLTTTDDVKAVRKTYQQKMKAKGWSEETSMNMSGQSMLIYKKENRIASISIAQADDATQISVSVATD
ncbi:MAG: hypothetical protein JRJ15_04925 [Deltaproteobacteria bacterium]|nr:hypothetical protein [Deltaproteobacteria bacterium]